MNEKQDKVAGALVGLLLGDAFGVPYEFHAAAALPPVEDLAFDPPKTFKRSHVGTPSGTWSDDGAQALAFLDSLVACGKFSAPSLERNLIAWFRGGRFTPDRRVFDVGLTTSHALNNIERGVEPTGIADEDACGNGSLMRVLPLALWQKGTDRELIEDAIASSAVTHAHPRCTVACALYCLFIRYLIDGIPEAFAVNRALDIMHEFARGDEAHERVLREVMSMQASPRPRGSGFVLDTLIAAFVCRGPLAFEARVRWAVSLGDDTDTTAAVVGGAAGAALGLSRIPLAWREQLRGSDVLQPLLSRLIERWK